jgi:enterochelin esterase family protein
MRPLLLLALTSLIATSSTAQAPAKAAGKVPWTPPPIKDLKAAMDAGRMDEAEALAWKLFGKQSLLQGKASFRNQGQWVAWGLANSKAASVQAADGKDIGKLQALGKDGLQVLIQELPNFTALAYQLKAGDQVVLAGEAKVEEFPVPKEAIFDPAIPQGKLEKFTWDQSQIYPNTVREVTVYIPAQFKPDNSASLMVWQDGSRHADPKGQMKTPIIYDKLISTGDMPVTVGVFIDPGRGAKQPADGKAMNRGFEYDSLGPRYSRLVLEEILPEVQKRFGVNWSAKPEDHAIAGGSSGGICAFTVAWERPDQFRKVLSWVGSFVDLRGGHVYPNLIRVTERKPLRVYLLDGDNDLDNAFGNWPLANLNMAASLKYQGYDYRFDYGHCFHGSKGMSASLPDALRWLWRK